MTEPGYIAPASPGWWVRTSRVGVNLTDQYNWGAVVSGRVPTRGAVDGAYGWVSAATGTAPSIFDAVGAGNSTTGGTSLTWSHTGTIDAAVVVWVMFVNSSSNGSISATYAGNAMTQRGSSLFFGYDGTFYFFVACFTYPAALVGAQTVGVAPVASSFIKANSVSYRDVSEFGTPVVNTGIGTSMTVSSVPSAIGHIVSNAFFAPSLSVALSAYNQTSRWSDTTTGTWTPVPILLGDAPGTTTVSFSATGNASSGWAGMAIDLS